MILKAFLLLAAINTAKASLIDVDTQNASLSIANEGNRLVLRVFQDSQQKLTAEIGGNISLSNYTACLGIENCVDFHEGTRLHVTSPRQNIFSIFWQTKDLNAVFQDCYDLNTSSLNWFGGPERYNQKWPIEKLILKDFPNIVSDAVDGEWGAVVEPYWLNSLGAFIFVDERTPLFIDQNNVRNGSVCFGAKADGPYILRSRVTLNYTVGIAENVREAHLLAVETVLGKPEAHPNPRIIERPIWSSWARYKRPINDSVILDYARQIRENGYIDGQLEIDDFWETCYGSLAFRTPEFSEINSTVAILKQMNYSVTLWVHPFVNKNCPEYTEIGLNNDFFIRNENGSEFTFWWNSDFRGAQHIDFTNEEARNWFVSRLKLLQENHGIDSFKFDAGETTWAPQVPMLYGDVELRPNLLTQEFIKTCAQFGDLLEMRVGWRTQHLGYLIRMLDKDSVWGDKNGLYTLITTLLQMNLNGYTMVLPDMVGGNGYNGAPNAELYIRWLQANVFMPTIQLSYVPWDYENEVEIDVLSISKRYIDMHYNFSNEILAAMNDSITLGYPVNAPVWWVDPDNEAAMAIDTQFMLGENILVAPVIIEGATSRDIFLPRGNWVDGNNGSVYAGNVTLFDYNAPIEVLPFFVREGSNAHRIVKYELA